jgi:hypothetical protein
MREQINLTVNLLSTGHHHTTTNGVERVRGNTGTSRDTPTEKEGGQEVALKRTSEDDRLERVVHAEVETTVDNDADDGRKETTVETSNTIGGEGLLVDVDETVELTLADGGALGSRLSVVGKTSTGVVERVDEEERSGTGSTTRGKVAGHPPGVAVPLLLPAEQGLEVVLEGEVEGLGREVTDDVGSVTTPDCGKEKESVKNSA